MSGDFDILNQKMTNFAIVAGKAIGTLQTSDKKTNDAIKLLVKAVELLLADVQSNTNTATQASLKARESLEKATQAEALANKNKAVVGALEELSEEFTKIGVDSLVEAANHLLSLYKAGNSGNQSVPPDVQATLQTLSDQLKVIKEKNTERDASIESIKTKVGNGTINTELGNNLIDAVNKAYKTAKDNAGNNGGSASNQDIQELSQKVQTIEGKLDLSGLSSDYDNNKDTLTKALNKVMTEAKVKTPPVDLTSIRNDIATIKQKDGQQDGLITSASQNATNALQQAQTANNKLGSTYSLANLSSDFNGHKNSLAEALNHAMTEAKNKGSGSGSTQFEGYTLVDIEDLDGVSSMEYQGLVKWFRYKFKSAQGEEKNFEIPNTYPMLYTVLASGQKGQGLTMNRLGRSPQVRFNVTNSMIDYVQLPTATLENPVVTGTNLKIGMSYHDGGVNNVKIANSLQEVSVDLASVFKSVPTPTDIGDAANKKYVDDTVEAALAGAGGGAITGKTLKSVEIVDYPSRVDNDFDHVGNYYKYVYEGSGGDQTIEYIPKTYPMIFQAGTRGVAGTGLADNALNMLVAKESNGSINQTSYLSLGLPTAKLTTPTLSGTSLTVGVEYRTGGVTGRLINNSAQTVSVDLAQLLKNVPNPTSSNHAVPKSYVDNNYIVKGTSINMAGNRITNVGLPQADTDVITRQWFNNTSEFRNQTIHLASTTGTGNTPQMSTSATSRVAGFPGSNRGNRFPVYDYGRTTLTLPSGNIYFRIRLWAIPGNQTELTKFLKENVLYFWFEGLSLPDEFPRDELMGLQFARDGVLETVFYHPTQLVIDFKAFRTNLNAATMGSKIHANIFTKFII